MADDDTDNEPAAKKQRLYYGSLEEAEKERILKQKMTGEDGTNTGTLSDNIKAGIEAGNIHIGNGKHLHSIRAVAAALILQCRLPLVQLSPWNRRIRMLWISRSKSYWKCLKQEREYVVHASLSSRHLE